MAATRKVFFGSLYEFSRNGEEEFLCGLRQQLEDPDQAPTIYYDKSTSLFSCEIECDDETLTPQIIASLGTYINRPRETKNVVESPRLQPIESTYHKEEKDNEDETASTNLFLPDAHQLLELDDSSGDEGSGLADDHVAKYWRPQNGDVSILNADTASAIADSSGCFLLPEPASRRIKIANGPTEVALGKLERLESVLALHAKHRPKNAHPVDSNIILFRAAPDSTIKFVRPVGSHPGFSRIILHSLQTPILTKALLGEIRVWQDNQRVRPANFDPANVSIMANHGFNETFKQLCMAPFGNPANEGPRAPSTTIIQGLRTAVQPSMPGQFLPPQSTKKVNEWMAGVDPQAGADEKPADPLPETRTKSGRRRVVASDSDDEDEPKTSGDASGDISGDTSGGTSGNTGNGWESQPAPLYVASRNIDWTVKLEVTPGQASSTVLPEADVVLTEAVPEMSAGETQIADRVITPEPGPPQQKKVGANMFSLLDTGADENEGDTEGSAPEKSNSSVKPLNVTFEEPASESPVPTAKDKVSPTRKSETSNVLPFDPSKYGAGKHRMKKNAESTRSTVSHLHRNSNNTLPRSTPTGPRAGADPIAESTQAGSGRTHNARDRNTNNYHYPKPRRETNLIDVSSNSPPDRPILPPPGFDYRRVMADSSSSFPLGPRQEGRSTPTVQSGSSSEGAVSKSPAKASATATSPLEFTPQMTVPKRNVVFLRDQMASQIQQEMNRRQTSDERSSRRHHKTMSQKSARPGKDAHNVGSVKKESKAAKKARIANAKAEAYGDTGSAKVVQPNLQRDNQSEVISTKKRQIIKKNNVLAEMHQDLVMKNSTDQAAEKVIAELKSILQATRALKGKVSLEFQLGQAIVLKGNRLDEARVYSPSDWAQLMNTTSQPGEQTVFTDILTTNGYEIDRLLSIKSKQLSVKLWDQAHPGPYSVEIEFDCRDRSGADFVITLDRNGHHEMRKHTSPIGQIALHCPTQIWDACAVVSGTPAFLRPSEDLTLGYEDFVKSLYVTHESSQGVSIYHRPPQNEWFVVRGIRMKRISLHDCTLPNRQNLQLRVTEVKNLAHLNHATDKKLYHSFEEDYDKMVARGNIHYEAAIVHKEVEKAFEANVELEIGELTPDEPVLTFAQARNLVEVTAQMLEGMDWVGAGNVGTIRRAAENNANQVATLASNLPPNMNVKLAIPMGTTAPPTVLPSVYQTQQSRLGAGAGTATNVPGPDLTPRIIHGVRANTVAELFQEGGVLFYYGLGGARIPVVDQHVEGMRFDHRGPVLPEDSASQIGHQRVRQPQAPVAKRGGRSAEVEKPAGFW